MTDRELPKINIHGHLRHTDDIRKRIQIWDEWNVVKFCCLACDPCLPWGGYGHYYGSEDTLNAMREYPDRIVGFASISAVRGNIPPAEAVEQFKGQGFTGLKFCGNSYPYSHEIYYPIYEKAQSLGMPVFFHTGLLAVSDPAVEKQYGIASEFMRPYHLEAILRSFPKLVVVGAHLGLPHPHEALAVIEVFPNAYYDFSGGSGHIIHVRKVMSALLPHPGLTTDMTNPNENRALFWFTKFCFGTDNPEPSVWVPASQTVMDRLEIPLDLRRKFYYENAARVLGLTPANA